LKRRKNSTTNQVPGLLTAIHIAEELPELSSLGVLSFLVSLQDLTLELVLELVLF
jgi:hypothetical protein